MKKNSILPLNVNPGYVPMEFVTSLASSYKALSNLLPIAMESSAMINRARTFNGKTFLESEAEWALLIDSDMVWLPESIIRLMKTAKEKHAKVVSGMTFMEQKNRIIPHAYAFIPDGNDGKVLAPYAVIPTMSEAFRVDAAGGACLLVHREVYEGVASMQQGKTAYLWQEDVYMPHADAMQGEDITFCKRAKEAGFDIWYEPRAFFGHQSKDKLLDIGKYVGFLDELNIEHPYEMA